MEEITLSVAEIAAIVGSNADDIKSKIIKTAEGAEPEPLTADEAKAVILELAKERRNVFHIEGINKGKRERMEAYEKAVTSKHGLTYTQKGEALFDAYAADKTAEIEALRAKLEELEKTKPTAKSLKELDENEAKAFIVNHPFFISESDKMKSAIAEKEKAFEMFKSEIEQRAITSKVEETALDILNNDFRPILNGDKDIDANLRRAFLNHLLSSANYKIDPEKGPLAIDEHGDPVKDANFKELSYQQWVINIAQKWYKPHPADPTKNAPQSGQNGKPGSAVVVPDWSKMTADQAFLLIEQEGDSAKRKLLSDSLTKHLEPRQ